MRKQEKTRLAELGADKSRNDAIQAYDDIVSIINLDYKYDHNRYI